MAPRVSVNITGAPAEVACAVAMALYSSLRQHKVATVAGVDIFAELRKGGLGETWPQVLTIHREDLMVRIDVTDPEPAADLSPAWPTEPGE